MMEGAKKDSADRQERGVQEWVGQEVEDPVGQVEVEVEVEVDQEVGVDPQVRVAVAVASKRRFMGS